MKILKAISISALLIALTGCMPHWTATQCNQTNMKQQGLEDGRAGKSNSTFVNYQTDCNKFKIALNRNHYMTGWKNGNNEFCKPNNLYEVGKSGKSYPGICSMKSTQRQAYNRGNQRFMKIRDIKSEIAALDGQINKPQRLQAEYNTTIQKMEQDRVNMSLYERRRDANEEALYTKAKVDLFAQKRRARTLHDQIIAVTAVNAANPASRNALINKRQRLQNELVKLDG